MTDAAKPWHEDDAFWEAVRPLLFPGDRWAAAPAEVDRLLVLSGAAPGARVLDLCCGVGRHSLELARRGFHVTGVDRSAGYLEQARERARTEGLEIEFVLDDMRRFERPEAFDLAVNLFTSFGYFEDAEDDRRALVHLERSLRPGGVLVMELMGKEILARIFRERDWREEEDGLLVLEERRLGRDFGGIENRWILIRGAERKDLRLSHRLYSAVELSNLVTACGFRTVETFGDLAGSPYDQRAARLVLVARK